MLPPHKLASFCLLAVLSGHIVQVVVANNNTTTTTTTPSKQPPQQPPQQQQQPQPQQQQQQQQQQQSDAFGLGVPWPIAELANKTESNLLDLAAQVKASFEDKGPLNSFINATNTINSAVGKQWSTVGNTFQVTNQVLSQALAQNIQAQSDSLASIAKAFGDLQNQLNSQFADKVQQDIADNTQQMLGFINNATDQWAQLNDKGAKAIDSLFNQMASPEDGLVSLLQNMAYQWGKIGNSGVNVTQNVIDNSKYLVQANADTLQQLGDTLNKTLSSFQVPSIKESVGKFGSFVQGMASNATGLQEILVKLTPDQAQKLMSAFGFN